MKRLLLVPALLALALAGVAAAAAPPYRLATLRPYLFFNDTGTFSAEVPENASLFNTIIGEGWAGHASNAVLVRVTVAGEAGSYESNRFVRLTVVRGTYASSGAIRWGRTVLDQRQSLAVLTRAGRTTAGFWLSDTGCFPLRLTARLGGHTASAPLVRVLPFGCGE
jgi:hypothetical protein